MSGVDSGFDLPLGRAEMPDAKRPRMMGMAMGMVPPAGMMYPVMAGMGPPGMMPVMPRMAPPPSAGGPPLMMGPPGLM